MATSRAFASARARVSLALREREREAEYVVFGADFLGAAVPVVAPAAAALLVDWASAPAGTPAYTKPVSAKTAVQKRDVLCMRCR